ncbi:MAG: 30S ribosomal protein S9 [Anaerolineae bacterium]|jgi:small subunit ribosomal protein S9|nr:30S ribosomal protein S9 [Anaerolineae bacterium]
MDTQYYEGVGRRKAATARVRLHPGGTGNITINDLPGAEYLTVRGSVEDVLRPLALFGQERTYDITVKVNGGGMVGQMGAIRLGVARALLKINEEQYRPELRKNGFLTRDPRVKERKKPGLKRARKAPTYTKR